MQLGLILISWRMLRNLHPYVFCNNQLFSTRSIPGSYSNYTSFAHYAKFLTACVLQPALFQFVENREAPIVASSWT